MAKWQKVDGPDSGDGLYVDRMSVPGGWIYKLEEWTRGGFTGNLESRQIVFVPKQPTSAS